MQVKNNTSNVKRAKRIAKGTFRFLKNKILSVNKNIPFISNLYLFLLKYGGFFFIALFVYPMLLCNIFMFIFPIISYEYNNFLIENYYIVLTKFIIGLLLFCISLFLNFFLSIPEIINNYHFNKKRLFVTIPKINKIFLFSCVLCFSIPISLYTSSFFSVYFAKKKNEFSITPKNVNFINKKTTTKEHIFIDVISITMCLIFSIILFFLISYFFSKNEFIFIRITNIINIVFPFMSLSFNKILCFITLLNLTYKINKIIFSLICLKYISKTYHLPLVDNGFIKV